jgi:hypothetical protein
MSDPIDEPQDELARDKSRPRSDRSPYNRRIDCADRDDANEHRPLNGRGRGNPKRQQAAQDTTSDRG